jgi:hypothetical protein
LSIIKTSHRSLSCGSKCCSVESKYLCRFHVGIAMVRKGCSLLVFILG